MADVVKRHVDDEQIKFAMKLARHSVARISPGWCRPAAVDHGVEAVMKERSNRSVKRRAELALRIGVRRR